ncbi:hypothetical protein HPP92_017719 [Vanilla planifolia]|uniref:NuBaID C-terminal domain-containing protein n=1 Tax=Vanilla planifolia TaxID=51239 RepID=A0A835QAQ7_VANPL|nr:hypothetical protein HPP92_017719 [Vanilla planifolia]
MSHALGHGSITVPSHSGNAIESSGNKISEGKLTRAGKETTGDDCDLGSDDVIGNSSGPQHEDNINKLEAAEFDPIKHHCSYCPWVNGNVAAAGANADIAFSSSGAVALTGWQLTLDALDAYLSLGHIPNQILQSDSAASLYKDDHFNHKNKILTQQSAIKSKKKRLS